MKLVAVAMVRNEEYWIWYSLTSVCGVVDEILLFDNYSEDNTLDVVAGMHHLGEKLRVYRDFGGTSEQENRELILGEARNRGATHVLFLDGDEVHDEANLGFCRRLLELHEHRDGIGDPPRNHGRPQDHAPTDGALVKNIGMRPIHPGFAGVDTCRPQDLTQPDTDHGCYNFAVRIASLRNLRGNGLEWGLHGYLETGDLYIQSSPQTLWLPQCTYHHFSWHPRSSVRDAGVEGYGRAPVDQGSVPIPAHVAVPNVLFRPDGPINPSLVSWGLRSAATTSVERPDAARC